MDNTKIIKKTYKYYLFSIISTLINIYFFDNFPIMLAWVGIGIALLMYILLIKNDLLEYVVYYLILLAPSLEFGAFISNNPDVVFYGFKNTKIFGINLALIFIFVPLIYIVLTQKFKLLFVKKQFKNTWLLTISFLFLTFTATIMGLLNIIFNDNSIQNLPRFWQLFVEQMYLSYWTLIVIIVSIIALKESKDKLYKLEHGLIGVLTSSSFGLLFAYFAGINGSYGSASTLLASVVSWYIPFLLLLPFYKKINFKLFIFLSWVFGIYFLAMFNANGKIVLLTGICAIVALYLFLKKNFLLKIQPLVLLVLLLTLLLGTILDSFILNAPLLKYKFESALALIQFWKEDWFQSMPNSPRIRIAEFVNVFYEYLRNPLQMFLGKGYLGSTRDHIDQFGWEIAGAFTKEQYSNDTFYRLHETVNFVFLWNGISGLIVLFLILKRVITNFNNNVWLLIGGIWMFLFYGYSLTIGIFGVLSLILGFVKLDIEKHKNQMS